MTFFLDLDPFRVMLVTAPSSLPGSSPVMGSTGGDLVFFRFFWVPGFVSCGKLSDFADFFLAFVAMARAGSGNDKSSTNR